MYEYLYMHIIHMYIYRCVLDIKMLTGSGYL